MAEWDAGRASTQQPISPKGDFTRQQARDRAYNSKAKGLIYGDNERPETPHKEGKKSVAHAVGEGAPFALYDASKDVAAAAAPSASHGPKVKKSHAEGAGKIGATEFSSTVYRNNLVNNAANMQASKQRNYGSGQVFNNTAERGMGATVGPGLSLRQPDAGAPYEVGMIITTPKAGSLLKSTAPLGGAEKLQGDE